MLLTDPLLSNIRCVHTICQGKAYHQSVELLPSVTLWRLQRDRFQLSSPTNANVHKYVDENDWTAILITQEVKQVSHQRCIVMEGTSCIWSCQVWTWLPLLWPWNPEEMSTRSPKQGYQWPHKRTCVHQNIKKKSFHGHGKWLPYLFSASNWATIPLMRYV